MAEQINQTLYDVKTPNINGNVAQIVLANTLLANIYQGQIFEEKRGVTQTYSTDTSGAQIRVRRILPLKQEAREVGASINGGSFNGEDSEYTQSTSYNINVLTVLDRNIDIPQLTIDVMDVNVLAAQIENFAGLVNRNANAMTVAEQLSKAFTNPDSLVELDGTEKEDINAIFDCSAKLDSGDEDNGVDAFPSEDRIFVTHPTFSADVFKKGILSIGGSNTAQELLSTGQLSLGAKPTLQDNGYKGTINGVPVHVASNLVWRTAEKYIGLPRYSLDSVVGYMASGMATARAIAVGERIKVIDAPSGQGIRLQPLVRLGVETFYPKSVVYVAKEGFVSPVDVLKGVGATGLSLKAPGSRSVITAEVSVNGANATPKFTANGANVAKAVYVFGDVSTPATLEGFYKEYTKEGAQKGNATNNTAVALTATGTKALFLLVSTSDGVCALVKSANVIKTASK